MPLIHMAFNEADARERGTNVCGIDPNNTGAPTIWLYETHHGLCIEDRERNGRDDSDWDMLVWDPAKGVAEWIEFASTRGWSYPCMGSKPDATPEVLAAYHEQRARAEAEGRRIHQERLAKMPTMGKRLRVIKGRKVPIGTEGECFWSSTHFRTDTVIGILFLGYEGRVGIRDASGARYFTNCENVEVLA